MNNFPNHCCGDCFARLNRFIGGVLALTLVASMGFAAQAAAIPGKIPANDRKGHITKADIEFFQHWEGEVDKGDQELRTAIEDGVKECDVAKRSPAAVKKVFKKSLAALIPEAEALGGLWGDLENRAEDIDSRRMSYSDARYRYIVGASSSLLAHAFAVRRSGDEFGLKQAAEALGRLDCSIKGHVGNYEKERTEEQKVFPEAIGHLEFVVAHEP